MRLLLLVLLLVAGLGVGYLALRRDDSTAPTGTGPNAPVATPTQPRAPLELDRGQPGSQRSSAAAAEAVPEPGATGAVLADTRPENVNPDVEKAPVFTNGVTADPVGSKPPLEGDAFYADKYAHASRAARMQAFDSLRAAVDIELSSSGKDSAELAAEMKREMEWLQNHYDPETP